MTREPKPPFAYSPLPGRPRLELPDGARVAVWIAVNVEYYPIDKPQISIVPVTTGFVPDPANYGWRDYGARVGIWRLMDLFDELGLPVTAPLNSDVCHRYPEILEEGTRRGWAWMAHGRDNSVFQANMERDEEREYLADVIDTIERASGRRPRGWLGPGLTETFNTPDLLAELGLRYVCDWCNDDQPYPLETSAGRLVSVPYSVEVNDIPLLVTNGMTGPGYQQALVDQFDALYEAGRETAQVMAIPLHPFLVGLPFRLKYLRAALQHVAGHEDVWLTTGDEIADWYIDQLPR
ncbi:MAG: hypothetical protein QOD53_867 [Thermoleophilaceae bacterium]|nr:hypothetical protein [Thermoleophilaceae bacterium]